MTNSEEISTATINHFTNLKSLCSILKSKYFEPRYCLENINHINWGKLLGLEPDVVGDLPQMAYPMVCFTDLPRDKWSIHKQKYGNCVITMAEEWKIRSMLVPVIYLVRDNFVSNNLLPRCLRLAILYCQEHQDDGAKNFINMLLPYFKLYADGNNRYYDEREWRYFPWDSMNGISMCLLKNDFDDEETRALRKKELLEKKDSVLRFEYNDIVCIEVPDMKAKDKITSILSESFDVDKTTASLKIQITE